jgi:mannose-6-phosphate isomerase-like protein (cupin superfamily)
VDLPKITDPRGNLTFMEGGKHLPFQIRRVFYLYGVPAGGSRGAHAHYRCHQFLICISGRFDVELDDGVGQRRVQLDQPWQGLHIPPMVWAAETNFGPGSICLVMASAQYEESDYIRDHAKYVSELERLFGA